MREPVCELQCGNWAVHAMHGEGGARDGRFLARPGEQDRDIFCMCILENSVSGGRTYSRKVAEFHAREVSSSALERAVR